MKRPNAMPSSWKLSTPRLVSAGLHRLPGLSNLVKPSKRMMAMIAMREKMPVMEAYESTDSGISTAGMSLCDKCVSSGDIESMREDNAHDQAEDFVCVRGVSRNNCM